jgi:hypothetical protein
VTSASAPVTATLPTVGAPSAAAPAEGELDLDRIVERVYERLLARLATERQRRGL